MKNNYGRFKIIVLISLILLLSIITWKASAGNTPHPLRNFTQQQEIFGIVTGPQDQPLAGVAVYIQGESTGTVTNREGEYAIRAAPGDILVFSYLGFKPVEVLLEEESNINVHMKEDVSFLGEVEINAGYYNTTRRESTGNISRVTAEEIEMQPVVSPLQALQGRMAGVEILPGGSHPGMAPTIQIRGQNSLRSEGNYPLYIIDGVPVNSTPLESNSLMGHTGIDPLNTLNLANIQSIEVLKDADATAIYGSRGANGVVLITTKKGNYGERGIEARIYSGISTVPNRIDLLNTEEYLEIRDRAFENDEVAPNEQNAYDLVLWDEDRYTDWQDFFFGNNSPVTDVNIAGSGGNENTSFRLGGAFHKQGTVYIGDFNYQKITANLGLNHRSKDDKLQVSLSVNYGVDNNHLLGNGVNIASSPFTLAPNAPAIFNNDGSLNWEDWGNAGLDNPLAGYFNSSRTQSNNLVSSLGLSYELFSGMILKTNVGYTNFESDELVKMPSRSYNPSDEVDHYSLYKQIERSSWIIEPQLNYELAVGNGTLSALIGGTFQENKNLHMGIQGEGYVSEAMIGNLSAAENIINSSTLNTTYRYAALFGRLGYNWRQKYFINLTGRRDGSSRFGPGKRFANFGAVGAAWIFSEEDFVNDGLGFLSFGKLRGSFGTTGNDQIGDYGYLDAYEATLGPGGIYPTQLSNPEYSWEENKKLEAAVELGFFEDRLNLGVSWYRNRSSNQLVGYPLPALTGFTSVQANLPATVQNTGWEVEVSSFNIRSDDFSWQTFFNISFPTNELLSYPNIEQSSYNNTYKVGHSLDVALLYQYEGIDPETGLYSITDVNEDGTLDYEDRVVTRDRGRQYYGGISNNLKFRNLSLQFLWEFVKQEGTVSSLFDAGQIGNQHEDVIENLSDNSRYQIISQSYEASRAYSNVLDTAFPYEDASFLRLKTLSIVYSLSSRFSNALGVSGGNLSINGQNLITLTNYRGMDPGMPYGGTSFAALRTVTCGLQINF